MSQTIKKIALIPAKLLLFFILQALSFCFISQKVHAQTEVEPWGNISGIRMKGQLMRFETSLVVAGKNGKKPHSTAKEEQNPKYRRDGKTQVISTRIDSLDFTEKVTDNEEGNSSVSISLKSRADTTLDGVYFMIRLGKEDFKNASVKLENDWIRTNTLELNNRNPSAKGKTRQIEIKSINESIKIGLEEQTLVSVQADTGKKHSGDILLYIPIARGDIRKEQEIVKVYHFFVAGRIDNALVRLQLNTSKPGSIFAGFGGNFRIQNPKTDPQVIDYSLNNLRVAWGRVEMPWRFWQPDKDADPAANAKNGKLHPAVQKAMEMAQRLAKMNIPIVLTAWSAPDWAIEGEPRFRHRPGDPWGNPLNYGNIEATYKSIADYLKYLKDNYGVDVKLFSFNESDLGINIRQTGDQHAELIKGLGAYLESRGLKTKLLLGDNSDATTYEFIYPAMADTAARKYIGAVSFHSWRGWETSILQKWADAARKLNLPLIVGEGSIDAAAWNYPAIFEEQTYALKEINLYARLLAICQPLTILQWQLTVDYSPLSGGGIFGNNGPLTPTQRFWNLKQLASTPQDVYAMPVKIASDQLSVAAMGNNLKHIYAVHIVNNGAARDIIMTGFPQTLTHGILYLTDKDHHMQKSNVNIRNGSARFNVASTSYVSLFSRK